MFGSQKSCALEIFLSSRPLPQNGAKDFGFIFFSCDNDRRFTKFTRPPMDSDNTMSSILKRKRAPVEVLDTPKRTKSSQNLPVGFSQKSSGWDAAFKPPPANTNGEGNHILSNGQLSNGQLASPDAEAIDFDQFVEESKNSADLARNAVAEISGKKKKKEKRDKKQKSTERSWRISTPIGGRMVDTDPVFTADEK